MNPNENSNEYDTEQTTENASPTPPNHLNPEPSQPQSEQNQFDSVDSAASENVTPSQPAAPVAPQPAAEDPGKTLGIISVVLDAVGLSLIGAILGYLSKKKSQEAGYDGTLGKIGMIIGLVFIGLGTLLFIAYIAIFAVAFSSLS